MNKKTVLNEIERKSWRKPFEEWKLTAEGSQERRNF